MVENKPNGRSRTARHPNAYLRHDRHRVEERREVRVRRVGGSQHGTVSIERGYLFQKPQIVRVKDLA